MESKRCFTIFIDQAILFYTAYTVGEKQDMETSGTCRNQTEYFMKSWCFSKALNYRSG